MAAPLFYNQGDQAIYNSGMSYVPQEKYRLGYTPPTTTPTAAPVSGGITNTNAFTNSGGDNYTGGYNFGNTGFQQAVDARQRNLNKPTDTSTFMGRTMGKVRDFIEPQSASQIMTDGYQEPRFQPGIIGMMVGKLDNYRNLPQANQAFISSRMGYTGPTIFGENNSGLSKNPYGINTRSMFGDYGSYVEKRSGELKEQLDRSKKDHIEKYGSLDAVNKFGNTWEKHNKNNIEQSGFYDDEDEEFQGFQDKQYTDRIKSFVENYNRPGVKEMFDKVYDGNNIHNDPPGTPPPGGKNSPDNYGAQGLQKSGSYGGNDTYSGQGSTVSSSGDVTDSSGNYSGNINDEFAKGGRAGYFFGGRVNYKVGGRTDAESQYGADSVGSYDSSANQSDRGQSYGINNNPPVSTGDNNKIVTTDFITENPSFTVDYTDPKNYASLYSKIGFNNILDNDDLTAAGNVTGEFGPIGYNTNFTDKGITGTNLTAGNFNANISPDMQVQNIGYSKGPFSISSDGQNTRAGLTFSYKNGGLAGLL